jgi:hypothetical protein
VQVDVEDVHALASNGNMDEQVQANVDVGETFTIDISRIEVVSIINMIEEQETIVF